MCESIADYSAQKSRSRYLRPLIQGRQSIVLFHFYLFFNRYDWKVKCVSIILLRVSVEVEPITAEQNKKKADYTPDWSSVNLIHGGERFDHPHYFMWPMKANQVCLPLVSF